MALTLSDEEMTDIINRINDMAILFETTLSEKRLSRYMTVLMRCSHLTTYQKLVGAINMAEEQLDTFPTPSALNRMYIRP